MLVGCDGGKGEWKEVNDASIKDEKVDVVENREKKRTLRNERKEKEKMF